MTVDHVRRSLLGSRQLMECGYLRFVSAAAFLTTVLVVGCGKKPVSSAEQTRQLAQNTNWTSFVDIGRTWRLEDLGEIERQRNARHREWRIAEESAYDKDKDGDVDLALWSEFAKHRYQHRVTEQKAVIAELMRRYDANHDGSLSRAEMMPILRDFLETDKFPDRGVRWDLRRRVLVLKYFDVNNDGFVDPVEDAVSDSVIKAARQKNRPDNEALRLGTNWPWG